MKLDPKNIIELVKDFIEYDVSEEFEKLRIAELLVISTKLDSVAIVLKECLNSAEKNIEAIHNHIDSKKNR